MQEVSKLASKSDVTHLIDASVHHAVNLHTKATVSDIQAINSRTRDDNSDMRSELASLGRALDSVQRDVDGRATVTEVRDALSTKADQLHVATALAALVRLCRAAESHVLTSSRHT